MPARIESRETYLLRDCAPDPVAAELAILDFPAHMQTQRGPEFHLVSVVFSDGVEVFNARQHAAQVVTRGDRGYSTHLGWLDIEGRAIERWHRENVEVMAALGEFFAAQQRSLA